MSRFRHFPLTLALAIALSGVLSFRAEAYPKFARKEKKSCAYCHLSEGGGDARGFRGLYYDGHKDSFKAFKEVVEAKKAGVKPNAMGKASKPTKPYTGKV